MNKRIFVFVLLALFVIPSFVSAQRVISNSQDWRDVYSSIIYANLNGYAGNFLVSKRHSTLLLNSIGSGAELLAISSSDVPQFVGYKSLLQARGYDADEWIFDNVNLELADRLESIDSFIVIDDAYGYNAISVAPYAAVSKSYVLFADKNNVDDVDGLLGDKGVKKLLIFGRVDREVIDVLSKYNPEIIDNNGDRFDNNIAIVEKYQEIAHQKQAILTNGEFIEQEIMSGVEPVLLLGAQNVPEKIQDYVRNSDIEVLVLIGNQYVGSATSIRRSTGASVFVKFAQGARAPSGPINPVEGLDLFYLPLISLSLSIFSVEYNQATGMLEITIKNNVEQGTYFKGTYTVVIGDKTQTVGDVEPLFVDGNGYRTTIYSIDPMTEDESGYIDAFVIYGESPGSLEKTIEGRYNITVVRVKDDSLLNITDLYYDVPKQEFGITLKNNGDADVYSDVTIVDLKIGRETTNLGLDDVAFIKAGKKKVVFIPAELRDDDIEKNPEVFVEARYGQRREGLIKYTSGRFKLKLKKVDVVFYSLVTAIVVVIILIILTKKKKCRHCGHKNHGKRTHCEKCGNEL
ncbi:zinc ribbon domain-containing protein [Candidatus Woesearchaeota archaeon]|nr:zinc ribbon domain-containing protein [Candidatus Woesearchaeota archaeon]